MAEFQASTTVNAAPGALFDYLSDVGNLPHYFARMTSARPGDRNEVHTTAQLPDGTQVEGDAWFLSDPDSRRISWGSEGPNDYHGSLEVTDTDTGCAVQVNLHTNRVPDADGTVQDGLETTVATIKRLIEEEYAIT